MRITSKGQVTIPQAIRKKAGLLPHTEVEFAMVRGQVVLEPVVSSTGDSDWAMAALQKARGTANEPMFRGWTTDRIVHFPRSED